MEIFNSSKCYKQNIETLKEHSSCGGLINRGGGKRSTLFLSPPLLFSHFAWALFLNDYTILVPYITRDSFFVCWWWWLYVNKVVHTFLVQVQSRSLKRQGWSTTTMSLVLSLSRCPFIEIFAFLGCSYPREDVKRRRSAVAN